MEEEIYHAELADAKRETNILNGLAGTTIAVSLVFLMLGVTLDAVVDKSASEEEDLGVRVPVWERGNLNYVTDQDNGYVMEFGPYDLLQTPNEWDSTHVFVEYELPLEEGGAAPNGVISLAYWRPNVPEGFKCQYANLDLLSKPSVQTQLSIPELAWKMIIEQILPHGYTFAQVSVTGTGRSNGMDLMGTAEQLEMMLQYLAW